MDTFELLFLGTSARNYSARLKEDLKDTFDKDVRRSACALLNGSILIDCGFHCLDSIRIAKVDITKISTLFLTHLHEDHCNFDKIEYIAKQKSKPLDLWVRCGAVIPKIENVNVHYLNKNEPVELEDGITVTSYLANHDEEMYPQHLVFEKNGKKFLYACDGAWLLKETYYSLKNANLDLAVLDCTVGDRVGDYRICEHNSIPMIRLMLPSFRTWGIINDKTKVLVSHLAQSLHAPHEETEKILSEIGASVAYDGLTVKI
ncbi:MAG: MBL fold metallo-hydrolase [Clostridiales bacterium]|nr:MBL fold metallo-hydrolase [Clostridiales bacterium]